MKGRTRLRSPPRLLRTFMQCYGIRQALGGVLLVPDVRKFKTCAGTFQHYFACRHTHQYPWVLNLKWRSSYGWRMFTVSNQSRECKQWSGAAQNRNQRIICTRFCLRGMTKGNLKIHKWELWGSWLCFLNLHTWYAKVSIWPSFESLGKLRIIGSDDWRYITRINTPNENESRAHRPHGLIDIFQIYRTLQSWGRLIYLLRSPAPHSASFSVEDDYFYSLLQVATLYCFKNVLRRTWICEPHKSYLEH